MKRLYRSQTDRKIFGICGGIGATYNLDPNLVRIVVVFLALSTGLVPMIITYLVARFLVPAAR